MSDMSTDERNWAQKLFGPRAGRKAPTTGGRLVLAAIFGAVAVWLFTQGEGVGIFIGLVALAAAGYQLLVAAIATGVIEGRGKSD